ncbi:MAG: O-antigen ligase family protein [Phycisphaerales bacterium JB043]
MNFDIDLSLAQVIILVFLALVTLLTTAASTRSLVLIPGLVIFLATIGLALNWWGTPIQTWLISVQLRRSDLVLAVGVMFALNILFRFQQMRVEYISKQALVLLAINLYAGMVRGIHEGMLSGLQSVFFAIMVTGSVIAGSSLLLSIYENPRKVTHAILIGNVLWLLAILVQLFVNPSVIILSNYRLIGLTANPQAAALALSTFIIFCVWMLLTAETRKHKQLILMLLAIDCALLLWTGSRTGTIMAIAGTSILLYRNMGKAVLWLPIASIVLFLVVQITLAVTGTGESVGRVVSFENTRTTVLPVLLESFMRNPLFGVGVQDAGNSENSYVYGLAAYGLGMGLLIAIFLASSIVKCVRLWSIGRAKGHPLASLADLVVAYQFVYFLGALAEGFIIARVSPLLFQMVIYSTIGTYVLRHAHELEEHLYETEEEYEQLPYATA